VEKEKISKEISKLAPIGAQRNVFGNSRASERILDVLRRGMQVKKVK
jgi:hypothetical protein